MAEALGETHLAKRDAESEQCKGAKSNPGCPYIAIITQSAADIAEIKRALIGDLNDIRSVQTGGGLVGKISRIEQAVKRRWTTKDLAAVIVAVAALVSALAALLT
jgi:hypothetical protein